MKYITTKKISGKIVVKTGLHIGAGNEKVEIGGMDNPIIRNPLTNEPYIPGSSVKGSIRTAYLAYKKRQFENNNDNSSIIEGKRLNAMNDKQKFSVELDPFKFLKVSDFISLDFDNNTEIRAEYNLMKTGKNILKI